MSLCINFDLELIKNTKAEVEECIKELNEYYNQIKNEKSVLDASFSGDDATALDSVWNSITDTESNYSKLVTQLSAYSAHLDYAIVQYLSAVSFAQTLSHSL